MPGCIGVMLGCMGVILGCIGVALPMLGCSGVAPPMLGCIGVCSNIHTAGAQQQCEPISALASYLGAWASYWAWHCPCLGAAALHRPCWGALASAATYTQQCGVGNSAVQERWERRCGLRAVVSAASGLKHVHKIHLFHTCQLSRPLQKHELNLI
jgi:hypothetical protein